MLLAVAVVIASYSGVFGGAERVLFDCATRMEREVVVMCPDGPLAQALRTAGITHRAIPERTLRKGPAHVAGLLRMAREFPDEQLVAWGARAVLAAAMSRRRLVAVPRGLYRVGVAGAADQPVAVSIGPTQ